MCVVLVWALGEGLREGEGESWNWTGQDRTGDKDAFKRGVEINGTTWI